MYGYTFFYANVPGIVTGTIIYRGTITVNAWILSRFAVFRRAYIWQL